MHLDPARKHDFVFLFDVRDGNPNGDPDAGGMPRTDPETQQGLVTDVAIKRKIRNMVALLGEGKPGYDIYVEAGVALNAQHKRAYAALGLKAGDGKNKPAPADQAAAQRWMCETFYDVRMFGAVMSTGNAPCGRVQGPLQISFSRSVGPVLSQEHGLTRVTQTREEDIAKGETTEMGAKHAIPYGLYVGYGHFSAPLAAPHRRHQRRPGDALARVHPDVRARPRVSPRRDDPARPVRLHPPRHVRLRPRPGPLRPDHGDLGPQRRATAVLRRLPGPDRYR